MKVTVIGVSGLLVNVNFITSTGSDGSIVNSSSGPSSVPSSVKASVGLSAGESTSISSKSDGVLKIASVPSSQPRYVDVELLVEEVEVLEDVDDELVEMNSHMCRATLAMVIGSSVGFVTVMESTPVTDGVITAFPFESVVTS